MRYEKILLCHFISSRLTIYTRLCLILFASGEVCSCPLKGNIEHPMFLIASIQRWMFLILWSIEQWMFSGCDNFNSGEVMFRWPLRLFVLLSTVCCVSTWGHLERPLLGEVERRLRRSHRSNTSLPLCYNWTQATFLSMFGFLFSFLPSKIIERERRLRVPSWFKSQPVFVFHDGKGGTRPSPRAPRPD